MCVSVGGKVRRVGVGREVASNARDIRGGPASLEEDGESHNSSSSPGGGLVMCCSILVVSGGCSEAGLTKIPSRNEACGPTIMSSPSTEPSGSHSA